MVKCDVEITCVGLRDLQPYLLLPIQKPHISFDLGDRKKWVIATFLFALFSIPCSRVCVRIDRSFDHWQSSYHYHHFSRWWFPLLTAVVLLYRAKDLKPSKDPSGAAPNYMTVLTFKNVEIPRDPIFAPAVNGRVIDNRLGGGECFLEWSELLSFFFFFPALLSGVVSAFFPLFSLFALQVVSERTSYCVFQLSSLPWGIYRFLSRSFFLGTTSWSTVGTVSGYDDFVVYFLLLSSHSHSLLSYFPSIVDCFSFSQSSRLLSLRQALLWWMVRSNWTASVKRTGCLHRRWRTVL